MTRTVKARGHGVWAGPEVSLCLPHFQLSRGLGGCRGGRSGAAVAVHDQGGGGDTHGRHSTTDGKPEKELGLDGSTKPLNRVKPKT